MQHLRIFMEALANPVAAVFTDHGTTPRFGKALDGVTDIAKPDTGPDHFNTGHHRSVSNVADTITLDRRLANRKHLAGITVPAILDDGDIDVHDIPVFQAFLIRYPMTDNMVDRGTDRAWKTPVVQRSRNGVLMDGDVFVTDFIEFNGLYTRLNMWTNHTQNLAGQLAGNPHLLNLIF